MEGNADLQNNGIRSHVVWLEKYVIIFTFLIVSKVVVYILQIDVSCLNLQGILDAVQLIVGTN